MHGINYLYAAAGLQGQISRQWDEQIARHMHISDGFSIVAMHGDQPVGLISVMWRQLPGQLAPSQEGFIDIIEIIPAYRRSGIARQLLRLAEQRVRSEGAHQLRAWSSEDKDAAIAMWRRLGFCLCPATVYPQGQAVQGFYVTKAVWE